MCKAGMVPKKNEWGVEACVPQPCYVHGCETCFADEPEQCGKCAGDLFLNGDKQVPGFALAGSCGRVVRCACCATRSPLPAGLQLLPCSIEHQHEARKHCTAA